MTNFVKVLFYISVCISMSSSCKSDVAVSTEEMQEAYGAWMLSEAVKDGKLTKTLKGATFLIDSNSFRTNIFGADETFDYKRTGDKINLSGDQSQLFTVDKSSTDTLILGMKRRKKQYQLLLVRDTTIVDR